MTPTPPFPLPANLPQPSHFSQACKPLRMSVFLPSHQDHGLLYLHCISLLLQPSLCETVFPMWLCSGQCLGPCLFCFILFSGSTWPLLMFKEDHFCKFQGMTPLICQKVGCTSVAYQPILAHFKHSCEIHKNTNTVFVHESQEVKMFQFYCPF